MSNSVLPVEIEPFAREAQMEDLSSYLKGAASLPLAGETDWADKATEHIEAGKERIEANPGDAGGWVLYVFGQTLQRNMGYACARRGKLLALGANNAYREIYEGSRQGADANLHVEDA